MGQLLLLSLIGEVSESYIIAKRNSSVMVSSVLRQWQCPLTLHGNHYLVFHFLQVVSRLFRLPSYNYTFTLSKRHRGLLWCGRASTIFMDYFYNALLFSQTDVDFSSTACTSRDPRISARTSAPAPGCTASLGRCGTSAGERCGTLAWGRCGTPGECRVDIASSGRCCRQSRGRCGTAAWGHIGTVPVGPAGIAAPRHCCIVAWVHCGTSAWEHFCIPAQAH